MKKERRITVLSIVINSLICFIKILSGLLFNSYTLVVSGYHTLCDTVLNFMGFIGSVIRGRRANRKEPFGYGKYECYSLMLTGLIISLLGIFIMIKAFFLDYKSTDIRILFILLLLILASNLFSNYLFKNAKSIQSEMLMDLTHISYYDILINILIVFFAFLSSIIPVFDFIGSLFLGTILIYKGRNIILNNYISLNCQNVQSKKVNKKIESIIKDSEGISYSNCTLVNIKKYYKAIIEIEINNGISLHDLITWEEYIKGNIKEENNNIRYVEFLIYKDEEREVV